MIYKEEPYKEKIEDNFKSHSSYLNNENSLELNDNGLIIETFIVDPSLEQNEMVKEILATE